MMGWMMRSYSIVDHRDDVVVVGAGGAGLRAALGMAAAGLRTACVSVHGANRLGSNSLLDIVVFGRAAAQRAAATVRPGERHPTTPNAATDRALARFDRLRWATGERSVGAIRADMQRAMQRHCSVFRNGSLLEQGRDRLTGIARTMRDGLGLTDRALVFNNDLVEALELDNMMPQAEVSLASAIGRAESRGAHAREDYPKRDDEAWLKHTLAFHRDGDVELAYRPVHLNTMSNEVASIPPKQRVY